MAYGTTIVISASTQLSFESENFIDLKKARIQKKAWDDDSVSDRNKNSINIKYFQYTKKSFFVYEAFIKKFMLFRVVTNILNFNVNFEVSTLSK